MKDYICYRKNIGTYPTWLAKLGRKILKFFLRKRANVVLRGRGKRRELAKKYGFKLNFDEDLPIKYAKKVAIYLTIKRSKYD